MNDNVIEFRRRDGGEPTAPVNRARIVLAQVDLSGAQGMTWKDVAEALSIHHGAASGLLSRLHKQGKIWRLAETRDGCKVYVTTNYVLGREVEHRRRRRGLVDDMAEALRKYQKECGHPAYAPHPTCRACEVRVLLIRYERGT